MIKEKLRSLSLESLLIKAEIIPRLDIFIGFNFVLKMIISFALHCVAMRSYRLSILHLDDVYISGSAERSHH